MHRLLRWLLKQVERWLSTHVDLTPFAEADVDGFKAGQDLASPRWMTIAELEAATAEQVEAEAKRRADWGKARGLTDAHPELQDLAKLGKKVVEYPPKVTEEDPRDWVTSELMRRTGGLTRHPADRTDYPEPPNEVDLAAREYVANNYRFITPFSHGYSMRYLGELLSRAKRKDRTLSTEDLMALRSRGLI